MHFVSVQLNLNLHKLNMNILAANYKSSFIKILIKVFLLTNRITMFPKHIYKMEKHCFAEELSNAVHILTG